MADCLNKITKYLKEPIIVREKEQYWINLPCGKCAICTERRKQEWGFRMGVQMRDSKTAYFVTLTYATKYVPINKKGIKTLGNKEEIDEDTGEITGGNLTRFLKRLRINQERSTDTWEHFYHGLRNTDKIKYYAAGEYGEKYKRPHFHLIIYNVSEVNIIKSWKLGEIHCVKANEATIAYTMKYLDKRVGKIIDKRKEPEFNTMSEGIGESYITKNALWHKRNLDILFVTTLTGIKIPMPRYYRLKLFTEQERKIQMLLVENKLQEKQDVEINLKGQERYWVDHWNKGEVKERIFQKKIKKRIQD